MFDLKLLKRIDWFTILLVVGLVTFGLISIASIMASPFSGEESSIGDYTAKLNMVYVNKQTVNFMVGAAAFLIIIVFDYQQVFKPLIKFAYIGIVGLLVLLIVMDKTQRGITGWFVFEAIDRAIQPGELCKICVIIALSKIVSEDMEARRQAENVQVNILCRRRMHRAYRADNGTAGLWHGVRAALYNGNDILYCQDIVGLYCRGCGGRRGWAAACVFLCI